MRQPGMTALSTFIVLLLLSLQLAACSAPAAPSASQVTPAPTVASAAPAAPAPTRAAPAPTAAQPAAPAPTAPKPAKKPTGTVTVGMTDLEAQAGTHERVSAAGMQVLSNVQEQLTYADPTGKLVPGLAESWELSADGLKWTFHLRKGVQFHESWGEFTSKDVKFSAELLYLPGSKNTVTPYFNANVKSVEAPDDYTVVFNMKVPVFDMPNQMSNMTRKFSVASKNYVDKVGLDKASERWIGTGPWQFVEYKTANYVKFKAVENHWRYTPDWEYLIIRQVPDTASRVMMLKAGDLDATDVPLDSVPDLEKSGFKVVTAPGQAFYLQYGGMYLPSKPTYRKDLPWVADPADNVAWERAKKVRLAMAMAIDKSAILDTIFRGKGELTAVAAMAPTNPGYNPAWKQYPYDPAGAKQLLAEAGYPNGFATTMSLITMPGKEELTDVGIATADMFGKIGLKVTTEKLDYNAVFSPRMVARQNYGLNPYGLTYPEAIMAWDLIARPTSQKLWMGENVELDKMLNAALRELDASKRYKLQTDIGQWMIDNVWAIPISTKDITFAYSPKKIKGWSLSPLNPYPNQTEYIYKVD